MKQLLTTRLPLYLNGDHQVYPPHTVSNEGLAAQQGMMHSKWTHPISPSQTCLMLGQPSSKTEYIHCGYCQKCIVKNVPHAQRTDDERSVELCAHHDLRVHSYRPRWLMCVETRHTWVIDHKVAQYRMVGQEWLEMIALWVQWREVAFWISKEYTPGHETKQKAWERGRVREGARTG